MPEGKKLRLHVKNNHWAPDTWPNTEEGETVFAITAERFEAVASRHKDVAKHLDVFIDWDEAHFVDSMRTADVFVGWNLPTRNLPQIAPNLRLIHITGAGVEHLWPMDWLPKQTTLVNSKGVHSIKAGEFGLMSVLMLHNYMPAIINNQTRSYWKSLFATPIAGRTLLIVGVGNIGSALAKHAKLLGLTVLGVTRHGRPVDYVDEIGTAEQLEAFLPRADFVFVATPATVETRNLLNAERLSLMKRGSGLINVGRAAVVDYVALEALLRAGHLGGAILDVFDPEPLSISSTLWRAPNVLITPHVSGDDATSYIEITLELLFDNLDRLLSGRPLRNIVQKDLGY